MKKDRILNVKGIGIALISIKTEDYISLTDMAKSFGSSSLIEKWLRNKDTIEYLGIWERINNDTFNSPEFEGIKNQAGFNRFTISVLQWIKKTNAIGIIAHTGRYGGTFAHKDIAFEFGSWLKSGIQIIPYKRIPKIKRRRN